MKFHKILLALTLFWGACYTAEAAYDDTGISARSVGLGNAFTAVADDVYSVYYNPAGLATLDRPELATTYSKLFTGLSDNSNLQNSFLSFASPIRDGKQGGYGLAWNYFSLDALYHETSLYGSYGRRLFSDTLPNGLFAGLSVKYLNRGMGHVAVADNALGPTGAATGVSDPVLRHGSQSSADIDVGLLYRVLPNVTVGMDVQHLLEPNIAFSASDTDLLRRNIKLGAAYRTPFAVLASDLQFHAAPDGSTDKTVILGAEKWLPTLLHGTFGIRGSLAAGTRDFRQVTAGVSYRIFRIQFDYGFAIPMGTVSQTAGTHRLGLSFRFGRSGAEPPISEAVLENMQELAQAGTPQFHYQIQELAAFQRSAMETYLAKANEAAVAGRFLEAQTALEQAKSLNPSDKRVADSLARAALVAKDFPVLADFRGDAALAALYGGSMSFIGGKDREAVTKLSYAQSLRPADPRFESLLKAVEARSGVARATGAPEISTVTAVGTENVGAKKLALLDAALKSGEYAQAVALANEVLDADPSQALAYKQQAAAYYALKQYPKALESAKAALLLERDPQERKTLSSYIQALEAMSSRKAAPAPRSASRAATSPQDIERMYEAGVELYAQGRVREALDLFESILRIEPGNQLARRAVERLSSELGQRQ